MIRRAGVFISIGCVFTLALAPSAVAAGQDTSLTNGPSAVSSARSPLRTEQTPLGTIVVDARGRTVYRFAADSKGHSACTGACLRSWPAVAAPKVLPAKLPGITAKVGSIRRTDGTRQLTLSGMPIYTFAGDAAAGDTSGQGLNAAGGKWWVVAPTGRVITSSPAASTPGSTPVSGDPGYAY